MEWMQEAYRQTRKDGAAGIDGVTAQAYEANLEVNLQDLRAICDCPCSNVSDSNVYWATRPDRCCICRGTGSVYGYELTCPWIFDPSIN